MTDLQQTPASNPKVMLKIFAQLPGAAQPETFIFNFTSAATARSEADAIKDALSTVIQNAKTGSPMPAANGGGGGGGGGTSAAMTIAQAVSSGGPGTTEWSDDSWLKKDTELQQSLLRKDPALQKTFMESLRTKPESINTSQFTDGFWSARLHLLRAHAIERSQTRGAYNVLPTIKPRNEENQVRLSISREQVALIFSQHAVVKRAYDESVPKLSEEKFWSRFFQSRLFKKLKGEKIVPSDPTDNVLDKYLDVDEEAERAKRLLNAHVPHTIDLEGNEQNHSQRKGNQPDLTMRPTHLDKVPIIRTLNSLSEKIMAQVQPSDIDPSAPIGMDEETFNQLQLRDLADDTEESRIILNIKDQTRFFSDDKENEVSQESKIYAKQDPKKVLFDLRDDLTSASEFDLATQIGFEVDSDSDDEETAAKPRVVSRSTLKKANTQVFTAVRDRRLQTEDLSNPTPGLVSVEQRSSGLSSIIYDRLTLTHATTTEFLHQFWNAFLSGDPDRAGEIAMLAQSLDRAMERISAVAEDAEKEKDAEIERLKKEARALYDKTGRKRPPDLESVKGGSVAVNQLLDPTVRAMGVATARYKKALTEQDGGAVG